MAAIALSNTQWQSGNPQFLADPVVGPYFNLQDLLDNATNPIPSAL